MKWLGSDKPSARVRKNEETKPNVSFITKFDLVSCVIVSTIAASMLFSVFDVTSIIKSRTSPLLSSIKQAIGYDAKRPTLDVIDESIRLHEAPSHLRMAWDR